MRQVMKRHWIGMRPVSYTHLDVYKRQSKRTAYSTGSDAPIPFVPGYAENLDCAVEVAAVIGRDALNITPEAAGDYIFGYTIANDVCDTRLNKAYTCLLYTSLYGSRHRL